MVVKKEMTTFICQILIQSSPNNCLEIMLILFSDFIQQVMTNLKHIYEDNVDVDMVFQQFKDHKENHTRPQLSRSSKTFVRIKKTTSHNW